jgi:membrane protease YdiL (CAAX protease family)
MKPNSISLRIVVALLMGVAIAVTAFVAPALFMMAEDVWLPPSFLTHTSMLLISFLIVAFLSRGKLSSYGFTRGSFRMTPTILLWIIPTSFLSVLQYVAMRSGAATIDAFNLSHLQVILFIWIYASICEETFIRGLLQGWLFPLGQYKVTLIRKWSLSIPVLFGGFFFGAMHIVLWPKMGPLAIMPMSLATGLGIVAGYYREKTGSLIPAVLIHSLFNIGGSLPLWVLIAFTT